MNAEQCPDFSNPISALSGNKFETEVDFAALGQGRLHYERNYDSVRGGWSHSYQQFLDVRLTTSGAPTLVFVNRPDGGVIEFNDDASGDWLSAADVDIKLVENVGGDWTLTLLDDSVEAYSSDGKLQSITTREGQTTTVTHNPTSGLISSVTDFTGRSLSFAHNVDNRLETMTSPAGDIVTYGYDSIGNLIEVIYPDLTPDPNDNPKRTYHYEDTSFPHALTGITDENGSRYITWSYDADGRATSGVWADSVGQESAAYGSNMVTVTNALGKDTEYTYDVINGVPRLTQVDGIATANCAATVSTVTYDANGYVDSKTDRRGIVTDYTYDASGLLTSKTEAVGLPESRSKTQTWHASWRVPTQIVEPGRTIDMTYDTSGRLLSRTITDTQAQTVPYVTTGNTRTVTYTYNAVGLIATIDGPRTDLSDVTTYGYTVSGDLSTITDALGHVTEIVTRDANGRPTLIRDANNLDTELVYSPRGWLLSRTLKSSQGDAVTSFAYDAVGQLTGITFPTGFQISYEYDAVHRLVAIENSLEERVEYTLDAAGNRTAEVVKGPGGAVSRTSQRTYDELSRLAELIDGASNATQYGYDLNDNQDEITDALVRSSTSEFDALDRLIKATDPDLGDTHYSYDDRGNVTQVIDPKGVITSYVYDGLDNLIQEVSADAGSRTYVYDAAGNMTQSTDARGTIADHSYDALNRLTAISYPAASAENVTYLYDTGSNAKGRLSVITDESGSTSFAYDDRGNITSDTRIVDGTTYAIAYAYDLADHQTSITYPSGRIVDLTVDGAGRPTDIAHTVSSITEVLIDGVQYEVFGGASAIAYGNGAFLLAEYDSAGRLAERRLLGSQGGGPAPVAYSDTASVVAQSSVTIDVLANDRDLDSGVLSIYAVTQPTEGSVVINPDETITFNAAGYGNSTETFTYQATDGSSPSNITIVTVNVATNFTDADGDGLHDPFEVSVGLDPTDGTDAVADADGDGVSNQDEYLAGTDPLFNDAGYASAVASSSPDARWSFDDAAPGTVIDSIGGRNISVLGGTHAMGQPSLLANGGSVEFSDAYGQATNGTSLYLNGDFTIETFARWTSSNWSMLFEKYRSSGSLGFPGPIIYANAGGPGGLLFHESNSARVISNTTHMNDGHWRHLAFVRRGSRMEIWINGKLDAVNENAPAVTTTNNQALRVMGYHSGLEVNGSLDELAIYQKALTPAEVIAHYQSQSDKDLDGMPNTWEMEFALDPLVDDATGDPDGDGTNSAAEYATQTDPMVHPSGWAAAMQADAPTAHWALDDASTVALDSSSSGTFDGTYYSTYTQLQSSPISGGDAVSFAGGYIEVPHNVGLNASGDYTVEGYFRWSGTTYGMAFGKFSMTSPFPGPTILVNFKDGSQTAGHIQCRDASGSGYEVSSTYSNLNDDAWRHYACVRRGNVLELWIDGVLNNTQALTSVYAFADTNPVYIMGRPAGLQTVTGGADEIAFHQSALSPADLRQRVIQGKQPSQASVEHRDTLIAEGGLLWVRDIRGQQVEYGAYELEKGGALSPAPDAKGPYDGFATLDAQGLSLLMLASGARGDFIYRRIPTGLRAGLVQVASGGLSETWTYGFDAVSNITGITKPAGTESYSYDDLDRLDSFSLPGSSSAAYAYDAVGNRLSSTESGVSTNLTYGTTSNRLLTNAGTSITYDANGNQIGDGTLTYTYNARDRLSQVSNSGGTVATYTYNALGQRVRKVAGSVDVDFVYDLDGRLLGEYANGTLIREYVHGPSGPLAQLDGSSVVYLHPDHLGTPRAATDANQTVVWRWEGRPFGESAADEDPDGDMTNVTVNLRFPGQYFDVETGLHYNYFRDYGPALGRYVTSDPIGLAGGLNRYGYVLQSPLVWTDPTGRVVPLLCVSNPMCVAGVAFVGRAAVGAAIGGLSALIEFLEDPCHRGAVVSTTLVGALSGAAATSLPGAGTLSATAVRGALAGFAGNAVGQYNRNAGLSGFNYATSAAAAATGAAAAGTGYLAAMGTANAAVAASEASAVSTLVEFVGTVLSAGLPQRESCECQ